MRKKTQKRTIGDVVQVPLEDGWHSYAQVLPEASFAFYDARVESDLPVDDIVKRPILFIVPVMEYAVKKGGWPIVGHVMPGQVVKSPPRFIQDALNKNHFEIYENGETRPATREECIGLERAAVWDPTHVQSRLLDHYAGRVNKWVESLKIRV
jgi:hypothetical protein